MRRARGSQLVIAFADSPRGGKDAGGSDVSKGKAYLLHTAKTTTTASLAAPANGSSRVLERVASAPNLARALLHVARNKGAPGVDGRSVDEIVERSPKLLPRLRHALLRGRYRSGEIRRVWIPKPQGGQRGLGIPNVIDRWVQQAVLQVLEPIFEPTFHDSSHGFRPRRGAPTALAEAKRHVESGHTVIVDFDLSKFFDRVHHQRLLSRIGQRVADRRVLDLVKQMLKARVVMPDGVRVPSNEGTPQGGPLSPLLSNIVLDELDWELERRGLRFVRYADDFLVFVRSERAAGRVMASACRFIERRLRLVVNAEKSAVRPPEQTHFLGFTLHREEDGSVEVHLSKRSRDRLYVRIRELTPRSWGQSLASCFKRLNRFVRGWMAHFRICTREGAELLRVADAHIRRRMRAIIIRHKRRPRHLYRHLVQRGVPFRAAAGAAYSSRGVWNRSNRPGMTIAYRNRWFRGRLLTLWDEWHRLNPPEPVSEQMLLFEL